MLEDYEEFISFTLRTRSSKKPFGMLERKLETPMAPAMPCKTCKKNKHGETRCKTDDFKSKFACILEASESTRMRMEESLPTYHEDHIAGRGDNSLQQYNLYTNWFLCHKQWRYPQQKQQWIKNGRNLKRSRRGTWQKSEQNQRWSMKQGRIGAKSPKNSRSSCTPRRHCERWFWILYSIYRTRIINQHHKWRQQKSWISYPDCQVA